MQVNTASGEKRRGHDEVTIGTTSGGDSGVKSLTKTLPRVLIVSRRTVRKNKFVDFVGEYHLDLIVRYGAVPVIVPRVPGVEDMLDSFEPIHGVLLCEGEDLHPSLYSRSSSASTFLEHEEAEEDLGEGQVEGGWGIGGERGLRLSEKEMEAVRQAHASDTSIDSSKDGIEMRLARRCLARGIPIMGICRGSQVLNVACGGSLYQDVETELLKKSGGREPAVKHIDYDNYDGHRHPVRVVENTPLHFWFKESLSKSPDGCLSVNSYHHQGIRVLAPRLSPMAFAPDGLVEAVFDRAAFAPSEGAFVIGLQFHPERMRCSHNVEPPPEASSASCPLPCTDHTLDFEYPECPRVYQEFVGAVVAYHGKLREHVREAESAEGGALEEIRETGETVRGGAVVKVKEKLRAVVESFDTARAVYEEERHMGLRLKGSQSNSRALRERDENGMTEDEQLGDSNNSGIHGHLSRSGSEAALELGACFLEENAVLTSAQVKRLGQMGATVRNAGLVKSASSSAGFDVRSKSRISAEPLVTSLENKSDAELEALVAYHQCMADSAARALKARRF